MAGRRPKSPEVYDEHHNYIGSQTKSSDLVPFTKPSSLEDCIQQIGAQLAALGDEQQLKFQEFFDLHQGNLHTLIIKGSERIISEWLVLASIQAVENYFPELILQRLVVIELFARCHSLVSQLFKRKAEAKSRSSHITVLNERELPYTSAHVTSTVIGDDGGKLCAAGVTAVYPSGALPVGTPIHMMVAELEGGLKVQGSISLSPQVSLNSHAGLYFPIMLSLPLEKSEGHKVIVMKSETVCTEPLVWEELPRTTFYYQDGCVDITTIGSTIYQAITCPDDLTRVDIIGEMLYVFGLEGSFAGDSKRLRIQFTNEVTPQVTEREGFTLVPPSGVLELRCPPCVDLHITLHGVDGSIVQRTSPYETSSKTVNNPLDEEFYVRVVRANHGFVSSFFRRITSLFRSPEGSFTQNWDWLVRRVGSHLIAGEGRLVIEPGIMVKRSTVEESRASVSSHQLNSLTIFQPISSPALTMPFLLRWPEVTVEEETVDGGDPPNASSSHRSTTGLSTTSRESRKTTEPSLVSKSNEHDLSGPFKDKRKRAEWRKARLDRLRNPLFPELAKTSRPFSSHWREIFRCLPVVKEEHDTRDDALLELAYLNPEPEIKNIYDNIRYQGSENVDSDCLQRLLNEWVDDKGGNATVGHLWDVLENVELGGAADNFFCEFFDKRMRSD